MSNILIRTAIVALVSVAAAFGEGFMFGPEWGWALLAAVFLVLLLHHARHLNLLRRWASRSLTESVPEGTGAWEEVFTLLYRRQRAEIEQRGQLARSLARSRQAGRALPYGVAILDSESRIVWCNDSCGTHFGIDPESDVGQPITYLVRQPEFVEYVAEEDFSKPIQLKTGRDGLVLSVQFVPYVDSQRLLLSRDITQGIRLETMRRDFVANVSHELRTPLTVLVGFLETVRELKLDPERSRDYLNLMAEQSKRMQRIIDDLLTLSTLESAPGFDLLGTESEIASAFGNLASNAVRYTPQGGEVRLIWRGSQKGAEFIVEDTGVGIDAEHIPRLTERFYRVDRGRSRETGGTGLGLAIVKHALARHQAALEIESTPGVGSRFTARFPARRVVPARARTANDALH